MNLRDLDPAALGYLAGWKLVRHLPDQLAEPLFNLGADYASGHGRGMEMLRRNLTRVVGAENVTAELVRDSVRSYARYWREAFRLPAIKDDPDLDARLTRGFVGLEHLDASHSSGREWSSPCRTRGTGTWRGCSWCAATAQSPPSPSG